MYTGRHSTLDDALAKQEQGPHDDVHATKVPGIARLGSLENPRNHAKNKTVANIVPFVKALNAQIRSARYGVAPAHAIVVLYQTPSIQTGYFGLQLYSERGHRPNVL